MTKLIKKIKGFFEYQPTDAERLDSNSKYYSPSFADFMGR